MTIKQRAMLGDKEAQRKITERGELLPCWRCGGEAELQEIHTGGKPVYAVSCKKHHCGALQKKTSPTIESGEII